jgi:membrane-associated phospholipid phosphatase
VVEVSIGIACLAAAVVLGAFLAHHRGQNPVDAWAYAHIPYQKRGQLPDIVVQLGSVPALLIGVVVFSVVSINRDDLRWISSVVGPVVAVVLADEILKPLVGRYIALDELTYPSGTVTVAASLATALVLLAGSRWRTMIIVGAAIAVVAVALSVLAMRWHFLTDVLGGLAVGVGTVLLIDGMARIAASGGVSALPDDPDSDRGDSDPELPAARQLVESGPEQTLTPAPTNDL